MKTKLLFASLLASLLWSDGGWSQGAVIADVQVTNPEARHYLLRIRSSGPQAFDVIPSPVNKSFALRLYKTRPGNYKPLGKLAFGTVSLTNEPSRGSTLLLVIPYAAYQSYKFVATQGVDPNVVEVRIRK